MPVSLCFAEEIVRSCHSKDYVTMADTGVMSNEGLQCSVPHPT